MRGKKGTLQREKTVEKQKGVKETETFADLIGYVADRIKEEYDWQYGGFKSVPKFLMPETLELMQAALVYQGGSWDELMEHAFHSMYQGEIYDKEEGGFFRYSTEKDWSKPRFEKMLKENSQMLYVILNYYKITGDEFYAKISREILSYLEKNLYLSSEQAWAASQHASEGYYTLPLQERKEKEPPIVDTTVYVGSNAFLVRSLFLAAAVLLEPRWFDLAVSTLKTLEENCYRPGKGMSHYLLEGEKSGQLWGLLENQVAMGRALSAAFQYTGKDSYLETARQLAKYCLENFTVYDGSLSRSPLDSEEEMKDGFPLASVVENAYCARWFVEMAALTGEDAYLEKAADIIHAFLDRKRELDLVEGASLALAALEAREPAVVIDVVGKPEDDALLPLHNAAVTAFIPPKVVRLYSPQKAAALEDKEYKSIKQATAFIKLGKRQLELADSPEEVEEIIQNLLQERRAHVLFTVKESSQVR